MSLSVRRSPCSHPEPWRRRAALLPFAVAPARPGGDRFSVTRGPRGASSSARAFPGPRVLWAARWSPACGACVQGLFCFRAREHLGGSGRPACPSLMTKVCPGALCCPLCRALSSRAERPPTATMTRSCWGRCWLGASGRGAWSAGLWSRGRLGLRGRSVPGGGAGGGRVWPAGQGLRWRGLCPGHGWLRMGVFCWAC